MPRGRYGLTPERKAHLAAIASLGGKARGLQRKLEWRGKIELLAARCETKADVWPLAFRAGYKAGASAGYRRGLKERG